MTAFRDPDGDELSVDPFNPLDPQGIQITIISDRHGTDLTVYLTADQAGALCTTIENYLSILEMSSDAGQEAATT